MQRLILLLALSAAILEGAVMADTRIHELPAPRLTQGAPLNELLRQRRSVREFSPQAITLAQAGQLLWAAQGITTRDGLRTSPSAGALYPLELHLVAGNVEGLPPGSYRYDPRRHTLQAEVAGELHHAIADAAVGQEWLARASAIVVVSTVYSRTTRKYGERGIRYVHIEVGHASQNLLLQAVALELGAVVVGAFNDNALHRLLKLPKQEHPLSILVLGHPEQP